MACHGDSDIPRQAFAVEAQGFDGLPAEQLELPGK